MTKRFILVLLWALPCFISHAARAEGVPFPKEVGFVLLQPEFRQKVFRAINETGLESPVLSSVHRQKVDTITPSDTFALNFVINNHIGVWPGKIILATALLNNNHGFLDLMHVSASAVWSDLPPIVDPNHSVEFDPEVAAILLSKKFDRALKKARRAYGRATELVLLSIDRQDPTDSERERDITAVYYMTIGQQDGALLKVISMRVALNSLDVTYPKKVVSVDWRIVH